MNPAVAEERQAPRVRPRILMADDDERLTAAVGEYLGANGLEVLPVARGDEVLAALERGRPDLVILDLMLPGRDGFEICRQLRAELNEIPVLILTARDEDFDHVLGMEIGADDYLVKPVAPRVLLAHVRAMLRRHWIRPGDALPRILTFGALTIDQLTREVTWRGGRVPMTSAEFDLLWLLASHAGELMHRDDILRRLRGLEHAHGDRSVDARLYRLRRRFGDAEGVLRRIKTIRPHRYLFSVEPW